MAHEIDMTTGVAAVFTVGEPPWHGLGANITEAQTSPPGRHLGSPGLECGALAPPGQAIPKARCPRSPATCIVPPSAPTHPRRPWAWSAMATHPVPKTHEAFAFMDTLVGEKLAMVRIGRRASGWPGGVDAGPYSPNSSG